MVTPIAVYYGQDILNNAIVLGGGGFTPANGELWTISSSSWDTGAPTGTPTGGGQTYTAAKTAAPGGFNGYARLDAVTVAGSPGSMQVTVPPPAGNTRHSACLIRWPVGSTLGAVNAVINGAGLPSSNLTTSVSGAAVHQASCDVSSVDPATRVYLNSATEAGLLDGHVGANSVQYHAYVTSIGVAGTYAVGLSAPSGQTWVQVCAEIQPAGGTTFTVTPTDSAGLTDSAITAATKVLTDSVGLTDALLDSAVKVLTDSAGLTDGASTAALKAVTDDVGLSDALVDRVTKVFSDSVGLSDPAFIVGPPPTAVSIEWDIRAHGSRWKITSAAPDTPDDGTAVRWRLT